MTIAARLNKEGSFLLNDNVNERLPVVTDGLVVHYPLDGGGGGFDVVGGSNTTQNIETITNLIEAMNADWRDPSSWSNSANLEWNEAYQALKIIGYHNMWLNTPLIVDTTKEYQVSMEIMEEEQSGTGLYLGGLCNNAAGQKVTANYDYSYAANAQPATGVWTTYRTTRTGTGGIVSRTSTTFANNSGWMGTAQSDNLTKYYYYGGLFNYSTGGVMYIRNLSIVAIDADTSNTIDTSEGMAVQLATTNIGYGVYLGFSGSRWSDVTSSTYPNGLSFKPHDVWKRISNNTYWGSFTSFIPTSPTPYNRTFTVSFWYFLEQDFDGSIVSKFTGAPTEGGNIYTTISTSLNSTFSSSIKGKWLYGEETLQITTDAFSYNYFQGWGSGTITNTSNCYIANFQLEEKPYASAFVGSSGSQGKIFLPIEQYLNNTEGTIHFKHKEYYGVSNTIISGSIVQNSPPNGKWWGFYRASNTTVYQHFLDGGSHNSGIVLTPYTWNSLTIKWSASYETYYINGVEIYEKARTAQNPTDQFPTITLGYGWTSGSGEFKDLSIFNKALSNDQIKQLSENNASIRTTEAVMPLFIESPVLPDGAYYYQLGETTKDITNTVDGSDTTNISYEDRAVWVGTATNNNYTTPDFDTATASANWNHWGGTGHIGTYGQNTDRDFILTPSHTYSHWVANGAGATADYLLYQACTYDGGYRSSQAMIKMSDGSPVTIDKVSVSANAWNGGSPINNWTSINHIGGGWYHCKWEGFSQDGTNDLVFFRILAGYKAYFDFAQLEDYKPFSSPMPVYGTRSAVSLEFNFFDSLGLSWAGNWSISYWKRPQATANDTLTSYSIESLGSNGNSVGGGYTWYGKSNGADTLSSSTPSAIIPANYFNHWHWISMVKTGTNIVTTTRGIEGNLLSVRNTTTTNSVANYYVNQYGYDFKFGWDNTNVTNAYFRDLVVVKRALSTAEEENLYKQMSIYKNKTLLKNIIEQGI